jgi:hypothetical protein
MQYVTNRILQQYLFKKKKKPHNHGTTTKQQEKYTKNIEGFFTIHTIIEIPPLPSCSIEFSLDA